MKKFRLLFLFVIVFALAGCEDPEFGAFSDDTTIQSINGTWTVVSFEDFLNKEVTLKTEENSWGTDIIITFDDTQQPHSVSGILTTNGVTGDFEYRPSRKIRVTRLGTTFVNQPEWGNLFSQAILSDDLSYGINDHQLRFFYNDGANSVTLQKD